MTIGHPLFSIALEPYFQSFHCTTASASRQILANLRILVSDMRVFVSLEFIIFNFEKNLALLAKLAPKRH